MLRARVWAPRRRLRRTDERGPKSAHLVSWSKWHIETRQRVAPQTYRPTCETNQYALYVIPQIHGGNFANLRLPYVNSGCFSGAPVDVVGFDDSS